MDELNRELNQFYFAVPAINNGRIIRSHSVPTVNAYPGSNEKFSAALRSSFNFPSKCFCFGKRSRRDFSGAPRQCKDMGTGLFYTLTLPFTEIIATSNIRGGSYF